MSAPRLLLESEGVLVERWLMKQALLMILGAAESYLNDA